MRGGWTVLRGLAAVCLAAGLTACGGSGTAPAASPSIAANSAEPAAVRVVKVLEKKQPWHVGAWSPATLTVPVSAGQSILVLVGQWNAGSAPARIVPGMSPGALVRVADQSPRIFDTVTTPVYGQLYAAFDLPAGSYTIMPPDEGGGAGDGTLYAVVVDGVKGVRADSVATYWAQGHVIPGMRIDSGRGVRKGDLVVALGGFDDAAVPVPGIVRMTDPAGPSGWSSIGLNPDATLYPPVQASWRIATADGAQQAQWSWSDPQVNVVFAVAAAFVPAK